MPKFEIACHGRRQWALYVTTETAAYRQGVLTSRKRAIAEALRIGGPNASITELN